MLPFQTLRYKSCMTMEEALLALRSKVEKPVFLKKANADYLGTVGDRFNIYRNIKGRNTFLPMLSGRLTPLPGGTEIAVRFGISWWVVAFCSGLLVVAFSMPRRIGLPAEGGWIVLFAIALMFVVGFFPEAERTERDLKRMVPPISDEKITQ